MVTSSTLAETGRHRRRRLRRRQGGQGRKKNLKADAGTDVRDVSGYIVSPGLIDLHTHVYWGGTSLGIDAEEFCKLSGVTTAVIRAAPGRAISPASASM